MKKQILQQSGVRNTHAMAWVGMILTIMLLAGCSTTGYRKGEAAAASIQSAAADVQRESIAMDASVNSLRELVGNPPAELKPQFQTFSKALDQLVACAKRREKTAQRMEQKCSTYFTAWDKQLASINYEVIRNGSEARRAEAQVQFDTVDRRYRETQAVVEPMITYLRDIRRALGSDLTPSGVASVRNVVAHTQQNTQKVQISLAALSTALNESSARMMPMMAAAQKSIEAPETRLTPTGRQ